MTEKRPLKEERALKPSPLDRTIAALRPAAGDAARIEARWLIEAASGDEAALAAMVARRLAGEPVERIIGRAGFWTLDLVVTPDTLSPRADTETVIRAAVEQMQPSQIRSERLHILDLGTGAGAILLALLAEFEDARGLGIDISEAALEVARTNAELANLHQRSEFRTGDWASGLDGPFGLIVSNPPYIPTAVIPTLDREVRDHDPHLALDGGADGLACYRSILPALPALLAEGGRAILEFGAGQGPEIRLLAEAAGLRFIAFRKDFNDLDRVVILSKI